MQETRVQLLGWEDPLEKGMVTYSSILAQRIPWTQEPDGLQSMGSQKIRHHLVGTCAHQCLLRIYNVLGIAFSHWFTVCKETQANCTSVCMCIPSQLHLTLWDLMDCSPSGSCVHGIFQTWILEWVAISYSRGSSKPRDGPWVSCISFTGRWVLYHCVTWEAMDTF